MLLLTVTAFSAGAQNPAPRGLASLVAAQKAAPESLSARREVEEAVGAGLPADLSPALLDALPVDVTTVSDALGTLVVPKPYLQTRTAEPQRGQFYTKVIYLYSSTGGTLTQFCQVHYGLPSDAPLAARIARLLALAHRTLVQKTGRPPENGDSAIHVWLCRNGSAGGEQWQHNLYLYDLDAPRSSIEWIREIIHEYSHLALPAIGGYRSPEYWANGYLGERLLVRWFQRLPGGPALVERVWGDFSGEPNFDRVLIAPPLALYQKVGASPRWLARTDEAGMRYLIGQALTIDDKYGGTVLGTAFARLPRNREARAADWGMAVSAVTSHSMARRP